MATTPDNAAEPTEPNKDNSFALHALLAYIASVLLIIPLQSILAIYSLNLTLLVTEVVLIALPAGVVLFRHRKAVDAKLFSIPRARQLSLAAVIGCCCTPIAIRAAIVTCKALFGFDPPDDDVLEDVWVVLIVFLAPICEELLLRPVIQNGLARHWSNRGAILVTALLFALFHLTAHRLTETFIIGLFVGIVFLKTRNFWCAVLVHMICNALGPVLMRNAEHLAFLLSPVASIGLACLAFTACYHLAEKSPTPLRGFWRRLGWAMFGTPAPLHATRSKSRPVALLTGGIVVCLVVLIGFGHVMLMSQLNPASKFDAAYVVSEKDEWTVASPEKILARSELTFRKFPEDYEDLILRLPFRDATLKEVKLGDDDLPFSRLEGKEYAVDLSSHRDAAASGAIVVRWSFPFSRLTPQPEHGYKTRLRSLAPCCSFILDVTVTEGSGFRSRKHRRFSWESSFGMPEEMNFYKFSCGVGIEREDNHSEEAQQTP